MMHPLLQTLTTKLADIDAQGLRRKRLSAETPCQPHLVVDGKPMLAFNSNDYLGFVWRRQRCIPPHQWTFSVARALGRKAGVHALPLP
jgi:hypothetical protein